MKIFDMLRANRYIDLVSLLRKESMLTGPCSMLKAECREWQKYGDGGKWSNQSWMCWLKIKAIKAGFYSDGDVDVDFLNRKLSPTVMHCFFIHIEETQAMIGRLSNESPDDPKEARSKISRTELKISPINETANIVTDRQFSREDE